MGDPAVSRKMLLEMMRDGLKTRDEKPWSDDAQNALVEFSKAGGRPDEVPQDLVNTYVNSYDMAPPRPRSDRPTVTDELGIPFNDTGANPRNKQYKDEMLDRGWDDLKRKEFMRHVEQLMQKEQQPAPSASLDVQGDGPFPPRPAPAARRSAFEFARRNI